MHPAVRIAVLLAFAAALPSLSLTAAAALLAALLAAQAAAGGRAAVTAYLADASRLRWLLLAIAMLYAGFTEGEPLVAALPGLSHEGAAEAGRRTLILLDLLAAVHWLLRPLPATELARGLLWLLKPVTWAGLDTAPLARRIALVFEEVRRIQQLPRSESWLQTAASWAEQVERNAGVLR